MGSPGHAPQSDPYGSLDSFVTNNRTAAPSGLSIPTTAMVSSPAPTTPGHGTPGTPGFAMWRPPGQDHQQQQVHPPQHMQFQQQYQPQHQHQQQFSIQHPPSQQPSTVATSPGGYFRPPVPPTPKPSTNAGNQFILELNPGSKAKGKAPVKPPKPKAMRPSISLSISTPLSPCVKEEPETPLSMDGTAPTASSTVRTFSASPYRALSLTSFNPGPHGRFNGCPTTYDQSTIARASPS